jgi:endonuclease YncB( thermonuclease family)
MRKGCNLAIFALLALIILPASAGGSPGEVYGRVSHVVDGDTFDLVVDHGDNRVSAGDTIRIRLADIDCPETRGAKACPEGKAATEYARAWLLGQYVYLDLDDKTGKDPYGRWVAVVYLSDQGKPGRNFNKMLVDAGQAKIKDYKNNEFDPGSWWAQK